MNINKLTRTEIINQLIAHNKYKTYLEIGVFDGDNFEKIICKSKIGVDPDLKREKVTIETIELTMNMTSDEAFKIFKQEKKKFDIIFIDGLHHAIQVYKDILNALDCLSKGGIIICHDMNPVSAKAQIVPRIQGEWNGDCWLAWVLLRATRTDLNMCVVDTDYGCGIIYKENNSSTNQPLIQINENLTYENLNKNRNEWLNLVSIF